MKIICIGRNYADHAKELNNPIPKAPVFFLKPDSSLLVKGKPFFYPEFSKDVHHEIELVLRINRVGKHIAQKFAHKYYDEIGVGIDFTARDLQAECKAKGLPWEIAKAFDGSAVLGDFANKRELGEANNIDFHLDVNGQTVQSANTSELLFSFDHVISYVSQFFTLKTNDLIYTGTPAGVGPVKINDHLQGYVGDRKMLDFRVK